MDEPVRPAPWRSFYLSISLLVLAAVLALFAGLAHSGQRAIEAELLARGRTGFEAMVLARAWNAQHGGVWVPRPPGAPAPPGLPRPELRAPDGSVLELHNPALMTREISELSARTGGLRFHITSLKPLNPANTPDAFEAGALAAFAGGQGEAAGGEQRDGRAWFRYMAPLKVETSCLACHAQQGYRVGDVRGGISVAFDMEEARASIRRHWWTTAALAVATTLSLLGALWLLVSGLRRRLAEAEARIRWLAVTDELTQVANRRAASEGLNEEVRRAGRYDRPLAVAMLDVDHFKQVNDAHGHDAGDAVLKAVAGALRAELRREDLVGRWGGEEFLVVLPEADAARAQAIAERLRVAVAALRVEHGGRELSVTVSLGVADNAHPSTRALSASAEVLVKLADTALYRAKAAGRDRVEVLEAATDVVVG